MQSMTFSCRDCENGYVTVGRMGANDPSTREAECDTCRGSGEIELEPQDAYEEAVSRLTHYRNMFHLEFRWNRTLGWKYHSEAERWLNAAKVARALMAEEEHGGAAHIGRAAA